MSPSAQAEAERWQRMRALFEQALDLPPEGVAALLDRSCAGDRELRAEVEDLLAADREAGTFLAAPAARDAILLGHDPDDPEGATLDESQCRAGEGQDGADPLAGRTIGPYSLLHRAGSGGMGEVFAARDERLDRTVALKRVRMGGAGATLLARERFRREARAAAGLSHPGIVQVFDLLEVEGEDWIVMEYVEGATLAALLQDGPLPEEQVLALAREIGEALAAAHARGLVHRDLKTENVLVTPAGRAKLLDFGLAKPWLEEEGTTLGPGLTGGALLGTARSMSPEQIEKRAVGPRSDLFSFGVLLYEAVTGESPFLHSSPEVTLRRVCTLRQPPAREHNPAVSTALSDLIDRLLAKEPERRPASVEAVLVELAAIAAAGASWRSFLRRPRARAAAPALLLAAVAAGIAWWPRPAPPTLHVAVLAPELHGDGDLEERDEREILVAGLSTAVQQALIGLDGVAALTTDDLEPALRQPLAAARALAADEILRSRLDCRGERCQAVLSRLAATDGRVLWTDRLDVPSDDPRLLATAVAARLRAAYPHLSPRAGTRLADLPPGVYEGYLRLLQRSRVGSGEDPELLAALAALRRRAPGFLETYLLEARTMRQAFYFSKDGAVVDRALDLLDAARELSPADPRVLFERFDLAREAGHWPVAESALAALADLAPGDPGVLERQADLALHRGRGSEALALMRRAAGLRPAFHHLYNLALMEYQQGEMAAARRTLETLLRRAPGSSQAQSLLAQLELAGGSLERAAALYRQLTTRSHSLVETSNLGFTYLLLGRFEDAAASYRQAYDQEPGNPSFALNLADAVASTGDPDGARALCRRVLALLDRSPQEPEWQGLTVRAQALAHLGREREAVAAVQRALQLAPDNPQVAFEAAIVYSLLGYSAPALVNAEKALQGGISPRWLRLPSFAPLRHEAAFQALLPPTGQGGV